MTEDVKPKSKMWIVGINLSVMLFYALAFYSQGGDALIAMWMVMLAHVGISFIIGVIAAILPQYKATSLPWILSSIAILLIGLSTCYMAVSGLGHM